MTEYIITDKQLKTATEAYLERELSRPITEVFVSGDKLPEIVRCRDCKYGHEGDWPTGIEIPSGYLDCTGPLVTTWDDWRDEPKDNPVEPDGFCAWGERREQ